MTNTSRRCWQLAIATLILALVAGMFSGVIATLQVGDYSELTPSTDLNHYNSVTPPRATTSTTSTNIRGIDVSKWNGSINWKQVSRTQVEFAFVRATYGADTVDPYFTSNVNGANDNGIKVGAYHYARFRTRSAMSKEASAFLKEVRKVKLTYPLVLDLEEHGGLNRNNLTTLANEFMDILTDAGYRVMLYSFENFFTGHLNMNRLNDVNFWVAKWSTTRPSINFVVWQYSNKGRVSGISGDVDVNIARHDLSTGRTTSAPAVTATPRRTWNEQDTDPPRTSTTVRPTYPGASNTSTSTPRPSGTSSSNTSSSSGSNGSSGGSSSGSGSSTSIARPLPGNAYSAVSFVNQQYSANLDSESPDLTPAQLRTALYKGLQTEINSQLGGRLEVNGGMGAKAVEHLSSLTFTSETKGRITTLLQGLLILEGHYTEAMTGKFDTNTVNAIRAFQQAKSLEVTGNMNAATWSALLGVSA